jgi:hypothetical protein
MGTSWYVRTASKNGSGWRIVSVALQAADDRAKDRVSSPGFDAIGSSRAPFACPVAVLARVLRGESLSLLAAGAAWRGDHPGLSLTHASN